MVPTLNYSGTTVICGNVSMPWDLEHNRPVDYQCEAGRIWAAWMEEYGITEPAAYVPQDGEIMPP